MSVTPTPSETPKEVNFKTIAVDFQTLANLHKQLNSFGLGDIDQLSYLTQSRNKEDNTQFNSPYYPLLYIVPSKVEHNPQYKTWEFNTTVSDIVEDSLQNNEDTLSDTLQILNDVVSQFRLSVIERFGDYIEKYYVDDEVVYTPYMGEQDDNLNGWNGVLRIKTMTSLDRCAAAYNTWTGSSIQHPDGINFKTFTDDFRVLADYHKQIQSFGVGKLDEFTYWNEMRLKEYNEHFNSPYYPYLFVIPGDVVNKFGFMEYTFKIIISDIIQRDLSNQIDVLSDTNQILDDIVGQFRLSVTESLGNFNELYYLDDTIVAMPFLEKYDDLLGGWAADLTIKVMTPLDRCDAAFNSWVTPTPTPTSPIPVPQCVPSLTGECPVYISRYSPNTFNYKNTGTTANLISFIDGCLPGQIAMDDNRLFIVDGCSNYYQYDYTITPDGCFEKVLVDTWNIWEPAGFEGIANFTLGMFDQDTLLVSTNISDTGSTLYQYNLITSGLTKWLEVGNNSRVGNIYYNTGNSQSILAYNYTSGGTGYYQLYSGNTNPQLVGEIPITSPIAGFTIYFSGNTPIAINNASAQFVLDFVNGTATLIEELLNGLLVPKLWVKFDDGFFNISNVASPASCYTFEIPFIPPTPSSTGGGAAFMNGNPVVINNLAVQSSYSVSDIQTNWGAAGTIPQIGFGLNVIR